MKNVEEILNEELNKLKISKTEREILIEEFEWQLEDFLDDEGPKPPAEKIRKFIKEFLKENAKEEKPKRQSQKESEQIDCIIRALKHDRQHLSIKDMSELLIRNGLKKGASFQNLYKWLPEELNEYCVEKDADGKYFYNNTYAEQNKIIQEIDKTEFSEAQKREQISIISSFLDSIKDSPVYEKAKEFLTKEEAKLKSFGNTNSANYSRILFMGAPVADIKNEIWDKIYKAMGTNAVLQIEYTPEGKTKSETYKVQPYQLIFDNGIWDLWAYCLRQKHEGRRLFNLSRISRVGILEFEKKFFLPKNYSFKNYVVGNFGCFNDEKPQVYKIKFSKNSYAWSYSKNRIWGAKQTIEECDDGYILSFEASQFMPILRWILGWGKDVVPLEPAELIKSWKDTVHEMAEQSV
ncbi:WYL domain-containing protein [Treponema sp.]|uniref:helix-turn-helix transcriptional regulator n=1 Tax=Treponema sp. TaxID=166 RepID=UPI00257A716B|nr:WYL domain-containing protein [Treponema sp.]